MRVAALLVMAAIAAGCESSADRAPAPGASRPVAGSAATQPPAGTRPDRRHGRLVRVARVVDGDTIELADGRRVRLVQIDTPEVSSFECYSGQATSALESMLPAGSRVRLERDPALDGVDRYGRLLRYVIRAGVNLNVALVHRGAAAPYFFDGDRGRYAGLLYSLAVRARREHRGLWKVCPGTLLRPTGAVSTSAAGALSETSSFAGGGSGRCTPGYAPCLADHGVDYDCAGGGGDGPAFTAPGVVYTVTGQDPYRLDGGGDGLGCE
jgi:endonuclease YncB( thermonuclease family)